MQSPRHLQTIARAQLMGCILFISACGGGGGGSSSSAQGGGVTPAPSQIPALNSVSKKSITVLSPIGAVVAPAPLPDPPVPASIGAPPAESNVRLWIYDPRSRSTKLDTAGIDIAVFGKKFEYKAASDDGSLYLTLKPGDYVMEVLVPSELSKVMTPRRYNLKVSGSGPDAVSIRGVVGDSQKIFAVTVHLNAKDKVADKRMAELENLAKTTSFKQTSECQLLDQVTPKRDLRVEISAGFPKVSWRLPSYGRIKALIVPLDFEDLRQTGKPKPQAVFEPIANGVRDLYYNASYGRLAFDFHVLPEWVSMPFKSDEYPRLGSEASGDSSGEYLHKVISLTDSLIDYAQYDAVYFLVPPNMPVSTMEFGPAITSPIQVKNGYITNGAIGGADMYQGNNMLISARNWMAHETGHALGLYDEDLGHTSATLGSWSLMADNWSSNAIEHNGWDRYLLGWLSEKQVACLPKTALGGNGITVTLNPLVRQNAETKVALVPLSKSKILVLESRKNEGMDVIAADSEGVLVYTVDMKLGQLKGGYQTQRRVGSIDEFFKDAALRKGDTITVDGVEIYVSNLSDNGDTVRVKSIK